MTTQKKLLFTGATLGILIALFVFLPGGLKTRFLGSAVIGNTTCNTQETKTFVRDDIGNLLDASKTNGVTGDKGAIRTDQATRDKVCQIFGYESSSAFLAQSWDSPKDNFLIYWDEVTKMFIRKNKTNPWVKSLTCTRTALSCIVDKCTDVANDPQTIGIQAELSEYMSRDPATGICSCNSKNPDINSNAANSTINSVTSCRIPAVQCDNLAKSIVGPLLNDNKTRTAPISGEALLKGRKYTLQYNAGLQYYNSTTKGFKGSIQFFVPTMYQFSLDAAETLPFEYNGEPITYRAIRPAAIATLTDTPKQPWTYKIVEACQAACPVGYTVQGNYCGKFPSQPTNLTATVENLRVKLQWVTGSDGGSPLTEYIVESSSDNGAHWTVVEHTPITGAIGTTYVTPATKGTSYKYRISAKNIYEQSIPSTATHPAVAIDNTPPIVTAVTSTKPDGRYTVGASIPVVVKFSEPVTSAENITVNFDTIPASSCTFSLSNSDTGTCTYIVAAGQNSADLTVTSITGNIQDAANNQLVIPALPTTNLGTSKNIVIDTAAPESPTGLTSSDITQSSVKITWTPLSTGAAGSPNSDLAGYKIFRAGVYIGATSAAVTSFVDTTGLVASTAYLYTVTAIDSVNNESAPSAPISVTTAPISVPSCTGNLPPIHYVIRSNVGDTSSVWTYNANATTGGATCQFQCETGYIYNSTNNTCTVTYTVEYREGTTVLATQTVTSPATTVGVLPIVSPAPTRSGYTFVGWSTFVNGGPVDFTETYPVTGNMLVLAKWTANTYTVTFDSQSATTAANPTTKTVTTPATTITTLPVDPFKNGYIFDRWYTAANGGGTQFLSNTTVAKDMTVYAKWNPISYTVIYDAQGGTPVPSQTVIPSVQSTVILPTAPTKTGHSFIGWFTTQTTGGAQFTATTIVADNITVYARWTLNSYIVTATTGANGSIDTPTKTVNHGATTTFTVTPDVGYTANVTGCGGTLVGNTYTTGPITSVCPITATFSQNTYTISATAGANGTVVAPATKTVNYGATTTFTVAPDVGYTANVAGTCGGSLVGNIYTTGPITSACTVSVTFSLNSATSYTITFNANDATATGTMAAQTLASGASANLTANGFAKTGYSFAGWATTATGAVAYANSASYTMGTTNITLFAKWTANNYAITFNSNSASATGTMAAQTLASGASANLTANGFNNPGYTFAGWATTATGAVAYANSASYTMGTANVTLFAKWSDNTAPTITAFVVPEYSRSLTVPITTLTASETSVSYLITESTTKPAADAAGWSTTKPVQYAATTVGTKTLSAWAKDGADNVSNVAVSDTVTIDMVAPAAPPRPTIPAGQAGVLIASVDWVEVSANTILISVVCTPGDMIKVYSSSSMLPIASQMCVTSPTTISIPLAGLPDGYYVFSVTATDPAGNESLRSLSFILQKNPLANNSAPGLPDIDALYDFGSSSTDNITREPQPKFLITCYTGYSVSLYDGATLIGTATCMGTTAGGGTGGIAQIIPTLPFTSGNHSITAKQTSSTGIVSVASPALAVTIDTVPLTLTLTKASSQTDPATNSSIQFVATFSRAIDANSFICADVAVTQGNCNSIMLISGNTYMINVIATGTGSIRVNIYAGRVQTIAGVLNTDSTGLNSVTYGSGGGGGGVTTRTNGLCSTLRKFTTTNPTRTSLNGESLCAVGSPGTVTYNSSLRKWTYTCNGLNGGATATCAISLNSESSCTLKPVDELPFNDCSIASGTGFFRYHSYLSCLDIVDTKKSCTDAKCTQNAPRQDLIYMASRIRGIPLDLSSDYRCENRYTDTVRGVPSWVCEVAEKAETAGLITGNNKKFRPLDTMTRAEAFKVILGSICSYPNYSSSNWQTDVAKQAIKLGFSTRTVGTFEPNRPLLKQELYVIAARAAEWYSEHPDNCEALPEELICE